MDQETKCSTEWEEKDSTNNDFMAQSTEGEKKKRKKKRDKLNPVEILKFVYQKTISAK